METTNEQAQPTRITKATIRIMNSFNWGNFESSLTIENESGINPAEVDELGIVAQDQVNTLVENYKITSQPETQVKPIGKKDNVSISDIEKLPMHPAAVKVKSTANHKEFERMNYLIEDCLTIKELMKLKKDVPIELNEVFNNKFIQLGDGK